MKISVIVSEAIKDRHPNETLEKAVGRVVRRHHGKYEDYLRTMADVRDLAYKKKLTVIEAAKLIASQP